MPPETPKLSSDSPSWRPNQGRFAKRNNIAAARPILIEFSINSIKYSWMALSMPGRPKGWPGSRSNSAQLRCSRMGDPRRGEYARPPNRPGQGHSQPMGVSSFPRDLITKAVALSSLVSILADHDARDNSMVRERLADLRSPGRTRGVKTRSRFSPVSPLAIRYFPFRTLSTMPRLSVSLSASTTARLRSGCWPRRYREAWACSTSTATAGSMFTASRVETSV